MHHIVSVLVGVVVVGFRSKILCDKLENCNDRQISNENPYILSNYGVMHARDDFYDLRFNWYTSYYLLEIYQHMRVVVKDHDYNLCEHNLERYRHILLFLRPPTTSDRAHTFFLTSKYHSSKYSSPMKFYATTQSTTCFYSGLSIM